MWGGASALWMSLQPLGLPLVPGRPLLASSQCRTIQPRDGSVDRACVPPPRTLPLSLVRLGASTADLRPIWAPSARPRVVSVAPLWTRVVVGRPGRLDPGSGTITLSPHEAGHLCVPLLNPEQK